MSTDDYVPSEAEMREAWRAFTGPNRDHGFGTWLARVRREAKAEAWDEAHEVGWNNADEYWRRDGLIPSYFKADTYPNPYRQEQTNE